MSTEGFHNALNRHGGLADDGVDPIGAETLEPILHQVHGLIGLGVGGLLVNDGDIRPQLGNLFLEAAGAVNLAVGTQLIHGDAYGAVLRQDLCQLSA